MEALSAALDGTGPAILPVDPRLPAGRVAALLQALRPATLETLDGTQRLDRGHSPALAPGTAVVIATSGSTGQPKGAELSAAALTHSARASLARIGARPGEAWLSCLPPSHISGLQVFLRSLLSGVPPVVSERLARAALGGRPPAVRVAGPDPGAPPAGRARWPRRAGRVPRDPARRGRGAGRAARRGGRGGGPGDHHLRDVARRAGAASTTGHRSTGSRSGPVPAAGSSWPARCCSPGTGGGLTSRRPPWTVAGSSRLTWARWVRRGGWRSGAAPTA